MKNLSVSIWRLLTLRSGDFRAGEKSGYQDNGQTESHFHLKLPSLYLESELLTWSSSPSTFISHPCSCSRRSRPTFGGGPKAGITPMVFDSVFLSNRAPL